MFVIDPNNDEADYNSVSIKMFKEADIVIDFSHADALQETLNTAIESNTNLIVGTTGWYKDMDNVRKKVEDSNIGFLWSSNFSIGVNLYFKVIEETAKLMNDYKEYDVWANEIHHNKKSDSPSGTAKSLENIILENIDRKKKVVEEKLDRKIKPEEFHFSSTRGGEVNFSHTVAFDSAADTVKIKHTARNRSGYALGAIKAAEWIKGKTGFFTMEDFLNL